MAISYHASRCWQVDRRLSFGSYSLVCRSVLHIMSAAAGRQASVVREHLSGASLGYVISCQLVLADTDCRQRGIPWCVDRSLHILLALAGRQASVDREVLSSTSFGIPYHVNRRWQRDSCCQRFTLWVVVGLPHISCRWSTAPCLWRATLCRVDRPHHIMPAYAG